MGTWSFKPEYAETAIGAIDVLKTWLYDKFGDDAVFDRLDAASERIREMSMETPTIEETSYMRNIQSMAKVLTKQHPNIIRTKVDSLMPKSYFAEWSPPVDD